MGLMRNDHLTLDKRQAPLRCYKNYYLEGKTQFPKFSSSSEECEVCVCMEPSSADTYCDSNLWLRVFQV